MGRQLTTEQVLLLENLMYLSAEKPLVDITDVEKNSTIGDWLEGIEMSQLDPENKYEHIITGKEWKDILTAVKNDPDLLGMKIVNTHIDNAAGGGKGVSALFLNPDTKEAVVAFRGTASKEWKDDFIGGGPTETRDSVSTQQQQNALEWYQSLDKGDFSSITVTGHSKGGNKAKYITIMDSTVDRCISFDGQGFSDEFIETYQDKIAQNQGKIVNHNVNYDFVNILLNDVGERIYYEGYDIGSFAENHCPNTFLNFGEDGNYTMTRTGQAWEMQEMDQFLNSCLRSLPKEERVKLLALIGETAETFLGGDKDDIDVNKLVQLFCEGNNTDSAAYLLAYLIEYEQAQPEFADAINSFMEHSGMQVPLFFVKMIEGIVNSDFFDIVIDGASFLADNLPGFIIKKIKDLAQKYGITLTEDQIRQLLGVLSKMNTYMDSIQIEKNGADKTVKSTPSDKGTAKFCVKTNALTMCQEEMAQYTHALQSLSEETVALNSSLQTIKSYLCVKRNLVIIEQRLIKIIQKCERMADVVGDAAALYDQTERRIVSNASTTPIRVRE